ncbi:hypothetical protein EDB92DRAFT_1875337 [Lactarius akahatsu]|uniref:DUF6533 domain-containing protein n=1 Tax=Lactarius akahatsu TaxID=416441 RepID=A0AAD4LHE0_9AGAM|nr:hypothetical protein EDB92DRAFT_1875337 [Lactarius akahatsu]
MIGEHVISVPSKVDQSTPSLAAYVICFYDWVISLDQEVALIYPAPWNSVKAAYLFCRYYPMTIAPFHIWGLVGNHEQRVCETYYHALAACAMPTLFITFVSVVSSVILMLRTYAFSGRKTRVLVVLSITYLGLAGIIIWVSSKELTLSPLFFFTKRNACFAISDEPNITALVASVSHGNSVPTPIAYHLGVLATFFDCLNMLVVLWHWVQGRDTFGPLGKSFLKQGMLVYVVMTALNVLSLCAFLGSYLVRYDLAASSVLANILPSALVIRFLSHLPLLMLRQKASPTDTKLRLEYSHMVDHALEMIAVGQCPEEISEGGFTLSISTDAEAQH